MRELESTRDTFESVWVAIVLAFVLRAFIVEAFVIPTGSMAPRLYGEHLQVTCPACGYEYAFGSVADIHQRGARYPEQSPLGALCPNCGSPPLDQKATIRSGDRVLVMKYLYDFREPSPWDVVVFKNPQNNRENYIKRLIGLPGEMIEIVHGDVFVRRGRDCDGDGRIDRRDFAHPDAASASPWTIRRKPRIAQEAMWQVVYDNDYRVDLSVFDRLARDDTPQPPRWEDLARTGRWDLSGENGRMFSFVGGQRAELNFVAADSVFLPHYGYNARKVEIQSGNIRPGVDVCSDLRLSFTFVPDSPDACVSLLLTSMEHQFKAELHGDGGATLLHRTDGQESWTDWGTVRLAPLKTGRGYELALTHVDFRVSFEVDGREVLASRDEKYPGNQDEAKARLEERLRHAADGNRPIPTPQVRIAAWGGKSDLRHVKLVRDEYYTCPDGLHEDRARIPAVLLKYFDRLASMGRIPDPPQAWGVTGNPIVLDKGPDRDLDEFFVLGDNSPQSLDGRSWSSAAATLRLWEKDGRILPDWQAGAEPVYKLGTVPRYNLIGKALFVYWPSGFSVPALPQIPIVPNVGRMRFIR